MGLSNAGFYTTVLATFSLILPLYWVCPFLQAFCEVPSIRSSSAIYLGLLWIFTLRPRKLFSLALDLGPYYEVGRAHKFSGPTLVVWMYKSYGTYCFFNIYYTSLHCFFFFFFVLFIIIMSWHIYCYTDIKNFTIFSQLLRCQFLISQNKIIKYEIVTNHSWK